MDIARLLQSAANLLADLQELQRALDPAGAPPSETGELPGMDYSGELAASAARAKAQSERDYHRANAIRARYGLPPLPPPGPEFTNTVGPPDENAGTLPPTKIGP